MKNIWIIAKKELNSFFDSLMAYIILTVFLGISGFFTWLYGNDIFFRGQASLQAFFNIAYWTLFFFIPAITMRMIAEEKKTGSIELLLTKAVNDWEVVIGKFLSGLLLILAALFFTLPYYITVSNIGPIDHGAAITGYIGMILFSMALLGIGIFASSITNNQIVAFLLALFIGVFFVIIFDILARNFGGNLGLFLSYLNLAYHYESISRGVIDSKNIIYLLSITFLALFFSVISLSKRNLAE